MRSRRREGGADAGSIASQRIGPGSESGQRPQGRATRSPLQDPDRGRRPEPGDPPGAAAAIVAMESPGRNTGGSAQRAAGNASETAIAATRKRHGTGTG